MKMFSNVMAALLVAVVVCPTVVVAQSPKDFKELKMGDQVPDYTFNNVINYAAPTLRLADLEGKLVIVDYWNTGCGSCIEAWPKMLSLQEEFGDKIQIILLNSEQDEATIRAVYAKQKKLKNVDVTLPTVCGDSFFEKLFPYEGLPAIVWIDKQGVSMAMTKADVVNSKRIASVLAGEPVKLPQKASSYYEKNVEKPLFVNGNGVIMDSVVWRKVISKYEPEMGSGFSIGKDGKYYYGVIANASAVEMLRILYSKDSCEAYRARGVQLNRLELRAKDMTKYMGTRDGKVQYDNLYCLRFVSKKPLGNNSIRRNMISEIGKYFNLEAYWEKEKRKCIVLTVDNSMLINYKSGETRADVTEQHLRLNNVTMAEIVLKLTDGPYRYSKFPIIDESQFTGRLGGIDIKTKVTDVSKLTRALGKYGIQVRVEDRDVDVLVVKEVGYEGTAYSFIK